ncbi:MAG: DUF4382 domain-containing protein [Leptospirales bacterium]
MKHIRLIVYFSFSIFFFAGVSCQNDPGTDGSSSDSGSGGNLEIFLHDAPLPGPIEEVNVTITQTDIVDASGNVSAISNNIYSFDLLTLTPDRPLLIFDQEIESGEYCQIRLHFAENSSVVIGGVNKPLMTPSATEWRSGFKINGCFTIETGATVTLVLDFIPADSIVYNPGPDRYILKPVIHLVGATDQIVNTYNMQGVYGTDAYVAQFDTDGNIRYVSSSDPRYIFNGTYTYNTITNLIHVTYNEVLEVNPNCETCDILNILPITDFVIDPKWTDFELLDYTENTILMKIISTGEIMNFASRIAFGPFDEIQ